MKKLCPWQHRALTLNPQTTDSQRLQLKLHNTWARPHHTTHTDLSSEVTEKLLSLTVRRDKRHADTDWDVQLTHSSKNESSAATGAQRPQMKVAYPGREDQRLQPESESNAVKPAQSIWNIPTQDSSVWQNNFLFLSNRDFHALKLKLEFWNPEGKRLINEQTSRFCAVVSVCMCVCVCVWGLVTEVRGEGRFLSGCVHDTHSWKTLATWVPHSSLPLTPAEVSKHAAHHPHFPLCFRTKHTHNEHKHSSHEASYMWKNKSKTQIPPHNLTSLLVEA